MADSLNRWRNFRLAEFACKCGCGQNRMQPAFIDDCQELRTRCGFPLPVNSGYRCPEYNVAVSTTGPHGPHTTGLAVDFGVDRLRALIVIEQAAGLNAKRVAAGLPRAFEGLGLRQTGASRFIHLDGIHAVGRPAIWTY